MNGLKKKFLFIAYFDTICIKKKTLSLFFTANNYSLL